MTIFLPDEPEKKKMVEDLTSIFDPFIDYHQGHMRVTMSTFQEDCLCDPQPPFQEVLENLLNTLSQKASPIYYCPYEYDEKDEDWDTEDLTAKEIVEQHPPSMGFGTLRYRVLESRLAP